MGTYLIEVKTAFGEWCLVETLQDATIDEAIEAKNSYQSQDLFNVYRLREQETPPESTESTKGALAYSDSVLAQTPFGEIDITIRSVNKDDLQKLRDIIIDFYEGLATMAQNMGDEVSTYGFYAEDRETQSNQLDCGNYSKDLEICQLYGGKCDHFNLKECAMYIPQSYPF